MKYLLDLKPLEYFEKNHFLEEENGDIYFWYNKDELDKWQNSLEFIGAINIQTIKSKYMIFDSHFVRSDITTWEWCYDELFDISTKTGIMKAKRKFPEYFI